MRQYIHTTQLSTKLDYKHLGKFRIIQKVSSYAYKLKLPANMKVYLVFHVSLLEPVAQDPLLGQVQPPPPLVIVNDNLEWEVEDILNSKLV